MWTSKLIINSVDSLRLLRNVFKKVPRCELCQGALSYCKNLCQEFTRDLSIIAIKKIK